MKEDATPYQVAADALVEITDAEIVAPSPREQIARATEEAGVLAKIINDQKLYSHIQGKKFVAVEGWTTLAALRGCTPREVSNTWEDRNGYMVYIATVELVNAQGRVIGRASAECGDGDEKDKKGNPVWGNRAAYAKRSMANTRATSKVCRQVLSWIMVLAGYSATPAEEVPKEGFQASTLPPSHPEQTASPQEPPRAAQEPARGTSKGNGEWDGNIRFKSGKNKGKAWKDVEQKFLDWALDQKQGPIAKMAQQEIARRARVEAEGSPETVQQAFDSNTAEEPPWPEQE